MSVWVQWMNECICAIAHNNNNIYFNFLHRLHCVPGCTMWVALHESHCMGCINCIGLCFFVWGVGGEGQVHRNAPV